MCAWENKFKLNRPLWTDIQLNDGICIRLSCMNEFVGQSQMYRNRMYTTEIEEGRGIQGKTFIALWKLERPSANRLRLWVGGGDRNEDCGGMSGVCACQCVRACARWR